MYKVFIVAKELAEIRQLTSGLTHTGFVCSVTNISSDLSEELIKQACDVLFVDIDGSSALAQTESILEQLQELRRSRHLPVVGLISGFQLKAQYVSEPVRWEITQYK